MNKIINKFNKFFLNEMLKGKRLYYYKEYISDSYVIVNLENIFYLNKEKMKETISIEEILEKQINKFDNFIKCVDYFIKEKRVYLKDSYNKDHVIDKKYFDLLKDYDIYFLNDSEISPVLFYSGDDLIAYLLPIRVY